MSITSDQAESIAIDAIAKNKIESIAFETLIEILQISDDLYNNEGAPFLRDEEYDTFKQYAHGINPTHPYFLGVGSTVRGGKVKLPYPMGSLTQVYAGETLGWIMKHGLQDQTVVVTDKMDGYAGLVVYDEKGDLQIGFSRGDGHEGADITRHLRKIPSLPQKVRNPGLVVRGEIIMKKASFSPVRDVVKSRSGKPYRNPRNMVAGLMNSSKNPDVVYKFIDFIAYEIIKGGDHGRKSSQLEELVIKHGFLVPGWIGYKGRELTDHVLTEHLNTRRADSKYEIDGVVLDVDRDDLRSQITPSKETLNPEYARKYKVADESNLAIATVVDVHWNISKDGYLKPQVEIEPVELVGVTVRHATGFNAKFIRDSGIGRGAKVRITRSGDVIPFILGVEEAATPSMPKGMDTTWTETGVDLILVDANSNSTVRFEQLLDFFNTLDVPSLKEGNLKPIFDAGFETPESVIELTQQDLGVLVGSQVIGKKIFTGLREKLTNIPLYKLMGAYPSFGRGVGVRKMKKLYEAFQGRMELCESVVQIAQVEGFDHKTATKIANGWPAFVKFREQTQKYITVAAYEAPKVGSLTGQTFVFTGFRSKELEKQVTDLGGKMGSTVSKNTSYVVAEDTNSTSGKAGKARELGIPLIGVEQLKEMLK